MWKANLTIETKNTIFHRESFSWKDVKDVFGKQRIREKSEDFENARSGENIAHLDQRWTMRGWMVVSRRRARGRPRAPGRNGTASGGENPGLVAEQHFLDFLRTLADHLRPPELFSSCKIARSTIWNVDPLPASNFVYLVVPPRSLNTTKIFTLCALLCNTCTSFFPFLFWISIIQ